MLKIYFFKIFVFLSLLNGIMPTSECMMTRLSNFFRKGMIGSGALVLAGMTAWHKSYGEDQFNQFYERLNAEPQSVQFVKDVLKDYGFPAEFINELHVKHMNSQFASLGKIIFIPFNDNQLFIAQALNAKSKLSSDHQRQFNRIMANHRDFLCEYDQDINSELRKRDCENSIDDCKTLLEGQGAYVGQETLDLWKAILTHEAGHVFLGFKTMIWPRTFAFATGILGARYGIYKTTSLLHKLFLKSSLYNKTSKKIGVTGNNIIVGIGQMPATIISLPGALISSFALGKHDEYVADKIMLNYVNDPAPLKKIAHSFTLNEKINIDELEKSEPKIFMIVQKYPFLYEFLDVHPRGSLRAKWALEQAAKLEKEQKEKSQK